MKNQNQVGIRSIPDWNKNRVLYLFVTLSPCYDARSHKKKERAYFTGSDNKLCGMTWNSDY